MHVHTCIHKRTHLPAWLCLKFTLNRQDVHMCSLVKCHADTWLSDLFAKPCLLLLFVWDSSCLWSSPGYRQSPQSAVSHMTLIMQLIDSSQLHSGQTNHFNAWSKECTDLKKKKSHFTSSPACIPQHIAPFICKNKDDEDNFVLNCIRIAWGKAQKIGCILYHCCLWVFVHHRIETRLNSLLLIMWFNCKACSRDSSSLKKQAKKKKVT